jgi:L-ascorbate metabolism protein UlaG (beta-lactamase superfamily)
MILEIDGQTFLTDPALDPAGGRYSYGWGTSSVKRLDPAMTGIQIPLVDAVLLSHDQHGDNLDVAGRAMLPQAKRVLTTKAGAARLRGNALGLGPWEKTKVGAVSVTAMPARYGWAGSLPLVGAVIGFLLEGSSPDGPIYIAGDTVRFGGTAEIAKRAKPRIAFLHMGKVGFGITGPLRYTMSAADGAGFAAELGAEVIVPLHFEGWSHFREGRADVERAFAVAGLAARVKWLTPGVRTEL